LKRPLSSIQIKFYAIDLDLSDTLKSLK